MRVLITGALPPDRIAMSELEGLGHRIYYMENERGPVPEGAHLADVIICNGLFLHQDWHSFPNLGLVQLTSSGLDRVPVADLEERGIRVFNAKGVYAIPISEWILMVILQFCKESRFFEENQRHHQWVKHRGLTELSGKTACIIGLGEIGIETAKRLRAFGVRIVGVRSSAQPSEYADLITTPSDLIETLPQADFVVVSVPLTPNTKGMIGAAEFASMKEGAIFVNVSRGAVVDEVALLAALQADRLGGAALDVFQEEPLPADNPLWANERAVVSPHNSFVSNENAARMWRRAIENLQQYERDTMRQAQLQGDSNS